MRRIAKASGRRVRARRRAAAALAVLALAAGPALAGCSDEGDGRQARTCLGRDVTIAATGATT